MSLRSAIVSQFKCPQGALGRLAGTIMANRPSNRARSRWTVERLALMGHHRVLEIGCGPGLALKACAARLENGQALGIDHSSLMVRQAGKRLAAEIESGRVVLRQGGLELLQREPGAFDRIFSINVVQFLPDLDEAYGKIAAALKPGGLLATTYQPRDRTPTREAAQSMAARVEAAMKRFGFQEVVCHELPLAPAPAICILGQR